MIARSPVSAAHALERRLLGYAADDTEPDHFDSLSLTELVSVMGPWRERVLSRLFLHAPEPGFTPWDLATTTELTELVHPPPSYRPEGLLLPPRFTTEAVNFLLTRSNDWTAWLRYAVSTTLFSDTQFDRLVDIVLPLVTTRHLDISEYLHLQVTTFDRLLALIDTPFTILPFGGWSPILLELIRSNDDLLAIAPYVHAECSARLLLTAHLGTYHRPSRVVIERFVLAQPRLARHLATVLSNPSFFNGHPSQDPILLTRLLLYVPGLPTVEALNEPLRSTDPPYRHLMARLIPRLFALSPDPAATRLLLDNPACSLAQALQASRSLISV